MSSLKTTTDGQPPRPGYENAPAPAPIDPKTGQHQAYWVLSEEERAKGFVRPVRRSYIHVGLKKPDNLRDLTPEERERYAEYGYVKFEEYPRGESAVLGKYWTQAELDRVEKGCKSETSLGQAIAETYARQPTFYGSTFCVHCNRHIPVSEFVWSSSPEERVGS